MNLKVINFINEYDYMIDEEDWYGFLVLMYQELGYAASCECIYNIKSILPELSILKLTNEQNALLEDKFYNFYRLWNHEKVNIAHILQKFNNFYGYSYQEAENYIINSLGLNVEYINGGYVISDV